MTAGLRGKAYHHPESMKTPLENFENRIRMETNCKKRVVRKLVYMTLWTGNSNCKAQYLPEWMILDYRSPQAFSLLKHSLCKAANPTMVKWLLQICLRIKPLYINLVESRAREKCYIPYHSQQSHCSSNSQFSTNTSQPCFHPNLCIYFGTWIDIQKGSAFTMSKC